MTTTDATPEPEHRLAWAKARRHLLEAEAMDLTLTPAAAVHSACYAMHLAAQSSTPAA
jgi:hypothetical protein